MRHCVLLQSAEASHSPRVAPPSSGVPSTYLPHSVPCVRSNIIHLEGVGCFKSETKLDVRASVFLVEEFGGLWSLFKMLRSKKLHPTHPHVQFTPEDCLR